MFFFLSFSKWTITKKNFIALTFALLCVKKFLFTALLHFTFQRCPFFFSALLCILHCICDKKQSKNITFFNTAAYYISEGLTKRFHLRSAALQFILHAISMPCRLFFSAFMADLIPYLSPIRRSS